MRRIVLLLSTLLLLTGCAEYRQISVDNVTVGSFRFNGTSSATIVLKALIDNPTGHTITLETLDAVLLREGKDFVKFSLDGAPAAAPRSKDTVDIPIKASVLDPISIITAGLDFKSWNMEDFVVDGKVVVRSDGGFRNTLNMKKTPLEDIVNGLK